jgi:hypothetical protein
MISHRFKKNVKNFDFTDENDTREYDLPEEHKKEYDIKVDNSKAKTHMGAYFGPHHEFGHLFDDLSKYDNDIENFYTECLRPFSDHTSPYKLVKSHWFSYNLDWLWDNCKGQDLFLLYKNSQTSRDWWFERGGWNIHHPVYTWYENDERLFEQIKIENTNLLNFVEEKGLEWQTYSEEWWQLKFGKKEKEFRFRPPVKEYLNQISVIYTKIT